MPQGLTDDSAVKNAYHEQLYELGQAFQAMYQAGALGASPEEFIDNLRTYESTLQPLGDFEQLKNAVSADITGPYAADHLDFVSQVMPLIPDQDGYSYDAKQRWYKDGELVTEQSDSAEPDAETSAPASAPGRMLDEEKGLYYDETNWYDGNGALLEWDATRNLYAAGDRWYDQNFVPLTWSDEKNLYYDSNNNWIDPNGFPLSWTAEGFYLSSGGARYDQYANPLPDAPATEPAAAPDEADGADQAAPAVAADVQAAVDDVIAAILEEDGTADLTSEEISELIADVLKDLQAA